MAWDPQNFETPLSVDAVGNLLAPDEGMRLVQAAVARLNAERCLKVL